MTDRRYEVFSFHTPTVTRASAYGQSIVIGLAGAGSRRSERIEDIADVRLFMDRDEARILRDTLTAALRRPAPYGDEDETFSPHATIEGSIVRCGAKRRDTGIPRWYESRCKAYQDERARMTEL